jgi:protein-S-isoprenylcysteine O-methyltransferase Ste14
MTISKMFAILYWVWIASELLLQLAARTSRSQGLVKDRGSLWLLLTVIFASVWAAFAYGDTHPQSMFGGAHWLRLAALVIMLAGFTIRWTAIISLGASFGTNVAIHSTQTLRTTGVYRWVRHPSYSGVLPNFAAVGIYQRNWVSLAIVMLFPTAALIYRFHVEEPALREAFGAQYAAYSKTTQRLVPGIY